jgi:hypothetical protein
VNSDAFETDAALCMYDHTLEFVFDWTCCSCVCVCVRERERERERVMFSHSNIEKHHERTPPYQSHCALFDMPLQAEEKTVRVKSRKQSKESTLSDYIKEIPPEISIHTFPKNTRTIPHKDMFHQVDTLQKNHNCLYHTYMLFETCVVAAIYNYR